MVWEYSTMYEDNNFTERLNERGKQGWELVSVNKLTDIQYMFIFKRRVFEQIMV